jgi:hypothetical protein
MPPKSQSQGRFAHTNSIASQKQKPPDLLARVWAVAELLAEAANQELSSGQDFWASQKTQQ